MIEIIIKGERFTVILLESHENLLMYEVRSNRTNKVIWNTFNKDKALAFWKEEEENIKFNKIEIIYTY
jgi:hypothetical protein